jgi:copper chaperone CopZ
MKVVKWMFVVVLLLGCVSGMYAIDGKKKKKTEEVTFKVSMHCANCQAKIEKNITWEKGVKDLKVELNEQKVTVVYNPKKISEENLKKSIENLGFTCEKIPEEAK